MQFTHFAGPELGPWRKHVSFIKELLVHVKMAAPIRLVIRKEGRPPKKEQGLTTGSSIVCLDSVIEIPVLNCLYKWGKMTRKRSCQRSTETYYTAIEGQFIIFNKKKSCLLALELPFKKKKGKKKKSELFGCLQLSHHIITE